MPQRSQRCPRRGPHFYANNTASSAEVVVGSSSSLLSGALLKGPFSELPELETHLRRDTQRFGDGVLPLQQFHIFMEGLSDLRIWRQDRRGC